MSRIGKLVRNQVTPEVAILYDKIFSQRGNVPNMFRAMAHRQEIFSSMMAHFEKVQPPSHFAVNQFKVAESGC